MGILKVVVWGGKVVVQWWYKWWYKYRNTVVEEADDSVEDEAEGHLSGVNEWNLQFHFSHHFFDYLQSDWLDFFRGQCQGSHLQSGAESFCWLLSGHLIDWIDSFSLFGLEKKEIELGVLMSVSENVSLAAAGSGETLVTSVNSAKEWFLTSV